MRRLYPPPSSIRQNDAPESPARTKRPFPVAPWFRRPPKVVSHREPPPSPPPRRPQEPVAACGKKTPGRGLATEGQNLLGALGGRGTTKAQGPSRQIWVATLALVAHPTARQSTRPPAPLRVPGQLPCHDVRTQFGSYEPESHQSESFLIYSQVPPASFLLFLLLLSLPLHHPRRFPVSRLNWPSKFRVVVLVRLASFLSPVHPFRISPSRQP